EREGLLKREWRYELPNGMVIRHQEKSATDALYREIFAEDTLPQNETAFGEKPCVFAAGANIGLFSLYLAQRWKDAVVHAFEPDPGAFGALGINTAVYGVNAKLYDFGLSSMSNGQRELDSTALSAEEEDELEELTGVQKDNYRYRRLSDVIRESAVEKI